MANENTSALNDKKALPNKLLNSDGSITDLNGGAISNPVPAYQNKSAIPNKFLNADGTYSTLSEIISDAVDADLFIIVDELPATGEANKIYLVPKAGGGFVEWAYNDNQWDTIGELEIDLSNYYNKTQTDTLLSGKINKSGDTMTGPLTTTELTVGSRKPDVVVGPSSVAFGYNQVSSGPYSVSHGLENYATGHSSHAEGNSTTAGRRPITFRGIGYISPKKITTCSW